MWFILFFGSVFFVLSIKSLKNGMCWFSYVIFGKLFEGFKELGGVFGLGCLV